MRIHALRLAERWLDTDNSLLAKVRAMTDDADPSVRIQLAMTLGEVGATMDRSRNSRISSERQGASRRFDRKAGPQKPAASALPLNSHNSDFSNDPKAVDALLKLARQHGSERWMAAAILSSSNDHAGQLLLGLLRNASLGKSRTLLQPLAATVAGRRDGSDMSLVLATIAGQDEAIGRACLAGFVEGISRGKKPVPESADGWASVSRLLNSESPSVRDLATKLAAKLPLADNDQLQIIFATAVKGTLDADGSLDQRRQAMQILASASYDTLAPAATKLLHANQPPALQLAAVASLAASRDERVGAALLKNWTGFTPQVRDAVLQAIFARANRLPVLLDAIENKTVRRGDISAIQREQFTATHDKQITARAQKLFANPTASAELQQRIDRYRKALSAARNVERGKQVFVKNCLNCHKLKDEGHNVGPPLGSITNKPDETILLDFLDPSGRIEPEYRSYIVATEDGRTFTGILVSESPTSVTLGKEKGENVSILRKDIDLIKASEVSLMPSNAYEKISPQDAADLIGFLRQAFNRPGKK